MPYEGPSLQPQKSRSLLAVILGIGALCALILFMNAPRLLDDEQFRLLVVIGAFVATAGAVAGIAFVFWSARKRLVEDAQCDHDWHKTESILHAECPVCGKTWKREPELHPG